MEIHWNTVITIDVFLLLGSETYLFWLIDWLIDLTLIVDLTFVKVLKIAAIGDGKSQ